MMPGQVLVTLQLVASFGRKPLHLLHVESLNDVDGLLDNIARRRWG
jgi:hypothetical protein